MVRAIDTTIKRHAHRERRRQPERSDDCVPLMLL